MKTASRHDWKIIPLSDQHVSLSVDRRFSDAEMEGIRRGFIPQDMDDRWFMFFEDNVLFIHRSWTGYGMFVAAFVEMDGEYVIENLRVNRNREQYNHVDDASDVDLFLRLLDLLQ
jgi:8-oxo-dGTP diphosphatase